MTRLGRALVALVAFALVASVSGRATFAAFTRTTSDGGNTYAAGTLTLGDNDAGAVLWDVANQLPTSAAIVRCIRVTYTGSLPATVRLYASGAASPLDAFLNVTVEKGSMPVATTFPGCGGFASEATLSPVGTLQAFKAARTGWATGIPAFPGAQTQWTTGDSLVFRFTVRLQDALAAQGLTALATFTWEAQNR